MRLHGQLMRLTDQTLSAEEVDALLIPVLDEEALARLREARSIDFAWQIDLADAAQRFRVNYYFQKYGMDGVFRVIPSHIPTLAELGLPETLGDMTRHHQGLVLVTGPAGSGKTSTLAALINLLNQSHPRHIITIEDPIEYIHTPQRSLINQRQVGTHTSSFTRALRAAVREDPDVILVGELRDLETTQMAITAAETGHLVFTTLHTNSSIRTIDRIIDAFPHEQQSHIRTMLSESLKGVIAQQLVPRADGQGRAAAVEVLVGTVSVANMIRDAKTFQIGSIMQTGKSFGMRIMDDSLRDLMNAGIITREEALKRATNPQFFA